MIEVDTKGMKCPMPMLKTKKALAKVEAGEVITVFATDPHAPKDLKQFCEQTGNEYVEEKLEDGIYTILIKRKPA